jgi:beta-lactamase class A
MKRKLLDRVLTTLSWVPSSRLGVPVVVLLATAPAAYMLLVPPSAPLRQGALSGAAAAAAKMQPVADDDELEEDPQAAAFAESFQRMTAELERSAQAYTGQVGIHVKDLRTGREWTYHADDLFPSASLIKVPILIGVMEKINRGELSLSSRLKLRRRTRMGGSGRIKWKRDGTRFTVRKLLDELIHRSDNTAMQILLDEVGIGWMQSQFPKMGLIYTELYPDGLSLRGGRVRYENYTTPREMTMLFERIYRGKMVDEFASELMLEIFKGKRRKRTRLAKGLPVGWEIAHKTGLLRKACHDAGIVFTPNGDFAITVLTARNRTYREAKNFITEIGKITYKHYKGDVGLYAKAPSRSGALSR